MTRIAISGVSGRMGRALVEGCHQGQGMRLGAALDRSGSPAIGADAGEIRERLHSVTVGKTA